MPSLVPVPTPTEVVYRVGGEITPPKLLSRPHPAIPEKCKRVAGWGVFIFEATITETGDVKDVSTLKRPDLKPPCPELEEAYLRDLSRWKYEPAKRGGKPVAVFLTTTLALHPR